MDRTWSAGDRWYIDLFTDGRGDRLVEDFAPYRSATVTTSSGERPPEGELQLTLSPVVESPGADQGLSIDSVFAVQVFNSHPERPIGDFAAFERRIMNRYYEFMLGARWQYAGLFELSTDGEFAYSRAEPYLIDAATIADAKALEELTSPEPPDILEIYAECSSFKSKDTRGRWLWFSSASRG